MRVDHRHCLASPASQWRCVVLDQREDLMRVTTINTPVSENDRGPWQDDFDPRPACAGRSLVQKMEDRLDEIIWDLMIMHAQGIDPGPLAGEARGVTSCISLVRTPYAPDDEKVKADAMVRYQARLSAVVA
jgi:hypothetical protein